jgi:hypothetical protein
VNQVHDVRPLSCSGRRAPGNPPLLSHLPHPASDLRLTTSARQCELAKNRLKALR